MPRADTAAFKKKKGSGPRRRSAGATAAAWGLTAALWLIVLTGAALAWFAYDLPSLDTALATTRKPTVQVLAHDGRQIARFGERRGDPIGIHELPFYVVQAVVATEDRRFYDHFGIDVFGIARAMVANLRAGRIVQGGSTITQQAAKNLFLSPERSLRRKVQEALLALALEERFSKDQILSVYLNRVYFGAGTYGIEAAAQAYFNVPAADLSLRQAAVIVGLLKAPSRLSPFTNPRGAIERSEVVLANMVDAGFLDQASLDDMLKHPVRFQPPADEQRIARHFVDWVMEQLEGYVGPEPGDITIRTTLDPRLQLAAEAELAGLLKQSGKTADVAEGAVVVMTPDGAVRALVGGRDYAESQFNRAVQAVRQPGSAFKPIIYLAALQAGVGPEQVFVDRPLDYGGWRPANYDNKFRGAVTVRQAVAQSINTVTVQVAEHTGLPRIVTTARRLGITTKLPNDLSLALGSADTTLIELTAAYAPFANGGDGVWAYGIDEIVDASGKRLYKRQGGGPGRIMEISDVATMNAMLADVIQSGTGTAAEIGRPAAGKTGTSSDFRDAWFVGYTSELVAGVWLGNDDNHPMKRVSGGGLPARLWQRIMAKAHAGLPVRPLIGLERGPLASLPPSRDPLLPKGDQEKSFWDRLKDAIGVR